MYRLLKQRNDELFEENRRLQQEYQRQQQNLAWRSTLQQAYTTEPSSQQQQQPMSHNDNLLSSSPLKPSNADIRRERSKIRSDSPNMSEGSDSTNYLTTVSVERYNNRPMSSMHRSTTLDGNNHHRTSRYTPMMSQEELNRNIYANSMTKSIDPQVNNYRSTKSKRSVEWDEENLHQNEGKFSIELIHISLKV
jgi:hypothetical protein